MNLLQPLERIGFSPYTSVAPRPRVDANYESNVRGMYVVGDLADSPVLKLVLEQGHEVGAQVALSLGSPSTNPEVLDVVVIGAGPAGVAAAAAIRDAGLTCVIFEKERPFNTVHVFPKGKPIYAEPDDHPNPTPLWLEDAPKEVLTDRWDAFLEGSGLFVHACEAVTRVTRDGRSFIVSTHVGADGRNPRFPTAPVPSDGSGKAENTYRARRIIVAVGKRGAVRRLDIPGEDLDKVRHRLDDAADHAGRRVLVVGGGDSAVEAAIATAEAGAQVTLSYRGAELTRPKRRNLDALMALVEAGTVRFEPGSAPTRITDTDVTLRRDGETFTLDNDDVLVFIGAGLPRDFLRRLGIQMEGDWRWGAFAWISGFVALVYAFYVLKRKAGFWPFGDGDPLGFLPGALELDLGFRTVDGSFWGTAIYSAVIVGFGIVALRRYRDSPEQRRRYLSLMGFQAFFLFGIPELLVPGIHALAGALDGLSGGFLEVFTGRYWKFYALSVPWPLSLWSLVEAPGWVAGGAPIESRHTWTAVVWTGVGLITTFVLIPLYVWRNNEKFCSYLCGCGGLAETFGDTWRHLAPRGVASRRLEWAGLVILFMAVPTTLLLVNDAWQFVTSPFLTDAKVFAAGWYDLMVDFMLASLVGVAMYPILGNRIWCRFFCPLRAYMQLIARFVGRLAIHSTDACISCGQCTRYCQMGIEVQTFAETQVSIDNSNSACIQCGICVHVCPLDVLTLAPGREPGLHPEPRSHLDATSPPGG